jgi:Serine dehydrogenase proteinase
MTDRAGVGTTTEPEGERPSAVRPFTKTPTFAPHNADRYQRRQLVTNVQELTDRTLICYIDTSEEGISRDDILGFADLLHNVVSHQPLDLLLHTGGGDIDATEKIIKMVRAVAGNAEFRIIVPDMAKSAGTLMTFGADQVLMSDTSELGPIDPQIPHVGASGELRRLSVLTYIKAYEEWKAILDANGNDVTACIMMSKLDPATLRHYRFVADRARNLAENLLKQGMFRLVPGNYTQIPADFMNLDHFSTHGQVIDAQDALRIGLSIEVLDRRSELWDAIWTLYTQQRMALGANSKLFESEYVCLPM